MSLDLTNRFPPYSRVLFCQKNGTSSVFLVKFACVAIPLFIAIVLARKIPAMGVRSLRSVRTRPALAAIPVLLVLVVWFGAIIFRSPSPEERHRDYVARLRKDLSIGSTAVRKNAASNLRHCKDAIPDLCKALGDSDGEVRREAADSLAGMGEDAIPQLRSALGDCQADVRATAAYAIARSPPCQ